MLIISSKNTYTQVDMVNQPVTSFIPDLCSDGDGLPEGIFHGAARHRDGSMVAISYQACYDDIDRAPKPSLIISLTCFLPLPFPLTFSFSSWCLLYALFLSSSPLCTGETH